MVSQESSRILDFYLSASGKSVWDGWEWYETAHRLTLALAQRAGWSTIQAAGVVSALSPSNRWERNLQDADAVADFFLAAQERNTPIERPKVCTYSSGLDKALRLAFMVEPGHPDVFNILRGPKTRAFAALLADPGLPYEVVVDRHAFRIARGEPPGPTRVSASDYARTAKAYFDAARELHRSGMRSALASQVQAVTWLEYRKQQGV